MLHKYCPLSCLMLHAGGQGPPGAVHRVGFVIFPSRRMALELASNTQKKKGLLKVTFRGLLAPGAEPWTSAAPPAISNITLLITWGRSRAAGALAVHTRRSAQEEGGAPEAHLDGAEGLRVAQLAELSLGAQQFGLNFWIHVRQKIPHVVHSGQGELWEAQLQRAGEVDIFRRWHLFSGFSSR